MNLSEIFIRRPVMTTLTMVAIVIFGLMSYVLLPISDLPSIDFPTIQVSANFPGATPDTMAASVATPLEKQFSSIAGIDSFNSTSSLGSTNITLQFNLDRNITEAAKDVQAAINAAAGDLPAGLPRLPTYRKLNPSAAPILYLYLYSKTLPISTESALFSAFSSGQVSLIYTPTDQFQVILEVLPQYQRDISAISSLYIRSSSGNLVPLSAVANFKQSVTPLTLNHQGEIPSATISYNLAPGTSLDEANQQITKLAASILPSTITGGFQGGAKAFQQSMQSLGLLLIVSIAVIYLILGILYEDFIHPLTILSGLPSAGFGAILTLILFDVELNVYSFIGIILLIGIVKKNGIMMVDFAIEAHRNEGKSPYDAIYQACLVRFRPIMMTTMAALTGTLPIALGLGAGSEARRPLGIAVVGGLVFSQILTLYLTPVYYLYMEAFRNFLSKRQTRQRIATDVTDRL